MQLTRRQIHEQVYFYSLILLAISLPLSIFSVTLSQIILLVNWLAEGRYRDKLYRLRKNPALWVFLLLYLLHAIALFWSADAAYSYKDMRVKVSLFIIPLVMGTSLTLLRSQINRILLVFTMAVCVASMASVMALLGWLPVEVEGYRDLSLFMSHIRFSLMVVLSILIVVWFLFLNRETISWYERLWYLAGLIWFPIFLVLLKSLSGIVIMGFLTFFLLARAIFEIRDSAIRFMVFVPVVMIPLFSIIYLGHAINRYYTFDEIHFDEIDSFTVLGNPYKNHPKLREVENGHYVWLHICDREMEEEWNKVSDINFKGKTSNGNTIEGTLIRFLTSKGLRKDAAGVRQLSKAEIEAVEMGVANHIYLQRFRLYPRIYEVIWEIDRYRLGYSPNEKSMVQRYLYLDAGWKIARDNLLFGVGNGDVKAEFVKYYDSINSPLDKQWRRRAHNQYLTFLISFGIPGLLICLAALVAPVFIAGRQHSYLAIGFLILMLLSMVNEDTLETSAGASFVAFFYSLFLFGPDFPWLKYKLFRRNARKA
ncbi:MAG: O-antigen ligase family protein [Bacteroidetes bacterium]|nr:O-antigen ligase family protein [Bacteroidota bacterium]